MGIDTNLFHRPATYALCAIFIVALMVAVPAYRHHQSLNAQIAEDLQIREQIGLAIRAKATPMEDRLISVSELMLEPLSEALPPKVIQKSGLPMLIFQFLRNSPPNDKITGVKLRFVLDEDDNLWWLDGGPKNLGKAFDASKAIAPSILLEICSRAKSGAIRDGRSYKFERYGGGVQPELRVDMMEVKTTIFDLEPIPIISERECTVQSSSNLREAAGECKRSIRSEY